MGNPVVYLKLDHLGVNHDESDLLGALGVENRDNEAVYAHTLTGTGGTGDKQVRGLGDIEHHRLTEDVASEDHGNPEAALAQGIKELPEAYSHPLFIGHLNSDGTLSGNGRQDSDLLSADTHADVVLEAGNLGYHDSGGKIIFVHGDGGSLDDVDEGHLHPEIVHDGAHDLTEVPCRVIDLIASGRIAFQQIGSRGCVSPVLSLQYRALTGIVAGKPADSHLELNLGG